MKRTKERDSIEIRIFRPLVIGTTLLCAFLVILAACAAFPAAQKAGMTSLLVIGALLVFTLGEGAMLCLFRQVSLKYLQPLSDAAEIAALASTGDLTRSADDIPPTSKETAALLRSVRETSGRSSDCLVKLEQTLRNLADGDFTVQVNCPRVSECCGVCRVVEDTGQKLRGAIGSIRTSLEQLSGPLDYLEQNAASLSGNSQEKEAGERLQAALENLTAQLRQRAEGAANVSRCAESLRQELVKFYTRQHTLEQSIEQISACAGAAGSIVKDLETASFQCSVLARTAYIEAAGAGVNGKGFAIVASELRVLASRIAQAAQEASIFVGEMRQTIREGESISSAASEDVQAISSAGTEVCRQAAGAAQEAVQTEHLQEAVCQANRLAALSSDTQSHANRLVSAARSLKARVKKLRGALQSFRLS